MPAEGRGSLAFRLIREYSSCLIGELSQYNPPSFICNSFSSVVFCGCFKRFMVLSQIFSGNTDRHSIVYHQFLKPFTAINVRFYPKTWYGWISMRAEVYGASGMP